MSFGFIMLDWGKFYFSLDFYVIFVIGFILLGNFNRKSINFFYHVLFQDNSGQSDRKVSFGVILLGMGKCYFSSNLDRSFFIWFHLVNFFIICQQIFAISYHFWDNLGQSCKMMDFVYSSNFQLFHYSSDLSALFTFDFSLRAFSKIPTDFLYLITFYVSLVAKARLRCYFLQAVLVFLEALYLWKY